MQRILWKTCQSSASVRSGPRQWYEDYQCGDRNSHMGVNGLLQIIVEKKASIRSILLENLSMSMRIAGPQAGLHYTPLQNILYLEWRLYSYKLQMHEEIYDLDKHNRIQFARYY